MSPAEDVGVTTERQKEAGMGKTVEKGARRKMWRRERAGRGEEDGGRKE